jgi:hypothetical protein
MVMLTRINKRKYDVRRKMYVPQHVDSQFIILNFKLKFHEKDIRLMHGIVPIYG